MSEERFVELVIYLMAGGDCRPFDRLDCDDFIR